MVNRYLIEYKIETLTELWNQNDNLGSFNFNSFDFKQWDFTFADGPLGDAWIARKEVEAENGLVAIKIFKKDLLDSVRKISFVSQCFASMDIETYFLVKLNNNPEKVFFLSWFNSTGSVPLHFEDDEKESLTKLETFEHPIAFEYISQSTRSATYATRLAMLIIALESIAGESSPGVTNKDFIKNSILQDEELYDEIFERISGIRNKIFHGKEVFYSKDYAEILYKKIVSYFNTNFGTKINTDVIEPQRTPFGNYLGSHAWFVAPADFTEWGLKQILELHESDKKREDVIRNGTIFHILTKPPEGY